MSTRCQVIVKDQHSEVWFYRHSDGYPEVTLPSLEQFLALVKDGKIRDNAEQASGWLVIQGHREYVEGGISPAEPGGEGCHGYGWKVGAYEPCDHEQHGDIEYLYTVDLHKKSISVKEV